MNNLNKEIKYVKGIGPKRANKLSKLGIYTISDLVYYFPRQYEDRNNLKKIFELQDEEKVTIKVLVNSIETSNIRKGLVITKVGVRDETGFAKLVFFNQEYISSTLKKGDTILVFGKVKKSVQGIELSSCEIEQLTNNPQNTCGIMPIYSLTYGLTNKELINIIKTVFNNEQINIKEYLPKRIIEKYKLCSIDYAVKNLHTPSNKESLKVALYRLVFEEFLMLQLG
ncbi:MAG: OB-fold nucleic acid binding domain-containing protein, partial [Peptostreptococcaceae bacterium]